MTDDDIIRIAREAGMGSACMGPVLCDFARLIQAATREECAVLAKGSHCPDCAADRIRALGTQSGEEG